MTTADIIPSTTDLAPLFARYRARKLAEGLKEKTLSNFVRAASIFQAWLAARGTEPEAVSEDDLLEFFAGLKHAASTKRTLWTQLRAAYRYAHRKGEIAADPFVDLRPPKVPEAEPTAIVSAELRKMRSRCSDWKQTLLWALLAYTGLRRDEIRRLAWDAGAENRVNLADGEIAVLGKGGKRRVVPVHPLLAELLAAAPDSNGFTDARRSGAVIWTSMSGRGTGSFYSSGQSMERVKLAFADEGCHAFRRTFASTLSRNGVPADVIDRLLGWAPASIRARYYVAATPADLKRAVLRAYEDDPIGA